MASFSLAVAVLLSSIASAHPPWYHPHPPAVHNDTCREAAPYVSALRSYNAASSLCSSVLGLTASWLILRRMDYSNVYSRQKL